MTNRAKILKEMFDNSVALPLKQLLTEGIIGKIFQEQGIRYRQMLYTPVVSGVTPQPCRTQSGKTPPQISLFRE